MYAESALLRSLLKNKVHIQSKSYEVRRHCIEIYHAQVVRIDGERNYQITPDLEIEITGYVAPTVEFFVSRALENLGIVSVPRPVTVREGKVKPVLYLDPVRQENMIGQVNIKQVRAAIDSQPVLEVWIHVNGQ